MDLPIKPPSPGTVCTVQLYCDDDTNETLTVTPLGSDLYRLEESPWMLGEFCDFGDVIEAKILSEKECAPVAEFALQFIRVVRRHELTRLNYVFTRKVAESPELQTVLDQVVEWGGHWEQEAVGVLILHVPLTTVEKVQASLEACVETVLRQDQPHCLRCKTASLVRLDSPDDISFYECPNCHRNFTQKEGRSLCALLSA